LQLLDDDVMAREQMVGLVRLEPFSEQGSRTEMLLEKTELVVVDLDRDDVLA
jgi:hypothetical protein